MLLEVGRLVSRLTLGAGIAAHGAQKAWGVFDGPGPAGAAGFMESLGFVPGSRYATAASSAEIGAGLLIALGLGGPIGPATLISTMIVAQVSVHAKNGFFAQKGGVELGTLYSALALALASSGPDRLSLDELLGWQRLRESGLTALVLAGGVAAGLLILAQRTPPASADGGVATESSAEHDDHRAPATDGPVAAT